MGNDKNNIDDLFETLKNGKKLFELMDKLSESREEQLAEIKISEISKFIKKIIDKNEEILCAPIMFEGLMKSLVELVDYIYNEELTVKKVVIEEYDGQHVRYKGNIGKTNIFTIGFVNEHEEDDDEDNEEDETERINDELKAFIGSLLKK